MGFTQSKLTISENIEKRLKTLSENINDIEYDLKHTSDKDFRKSIKNRNILKISKDFLHIQTLLEQEDIIENLSDKERFNIQNSLDELSNRIKNIEKYP